MTEFWWFTVLIGVVLGLLVAVVLHGLERWRENREKRRRDELLSSLIERRLPDD